MNITQFCLNNAVVTWLAVVLLAVGGLAAYAKLGKLEDPEFTVKTAVITTAYPGASPEQVEKEVTEVIALAVQEVAEVDYVETTSRQALSMVKVEIKSQYWSDALPQIWDDLRRRIREVEGDLPQGAGRPAVNDDFGDVFGFVLAVTGDGFDYNALEQQAKDLKRQLSLVEGVGKVTFWGKQNRAVYVEVSEAQLAGTGITIDDIAATLARQNAVAPAGNVYFDTTASRIEVTGAFVDPQDVGDLVVRGSGVTASGDAGRRQAADSLIRIRDIAQVKQDFIEPQPQTMRFDGKPAIGIAISNVTGANIIQLGAALDARLAELAGQIPIGIEVHRVAWQANEVSTAINSFVVSLGQAVAIVLVVLAIAMGWRMGVIIGTALILTIAGTMIIMSVMGIDLQRMSLGALVIALGMMVDNAIVVADGIAVRIARGMERRRAAVEAATQPAIPLLGATFIAVLAFYPIGGSPDSTGEYCLSLFQVVGISLLFSWIVSITVTPLQCVAMLPAPKDGDGDRDPYAGVFFTVYRKLLKGALAARTVTLAVMVAALVASGVGFGYVPQIFFPDSSRPQFMVDLYAPNGTRVGHTSDLLKEIEARLLPMEGVEAVSTFVGSGPPRFYLPVEPEAFYTSYGQIIVTVDDFRRIDAMKAELEPWLAQEFPGVPVLRIRKFGVGPSDAWPFEFRVIAPAGARLDELRAVGQAGLAIVESHPGVEAAQLDWRERTPKVVVPYDQARGLWAGVGRTDVAAATTRAFDGQPIGQFRERDELLPILVRNAGAERENPATLYGIQVPQSGILSRGSVPLTQVTGPIEVEWQDTQIGGRDRRRTIRVQAAPVAGVTVPSIAADLAADLDAWRASLPPGYVVEWGGEIESTANSQAGLAPGVPPAIIAMFFIIVALFNAMRPAIVIFLTVPLAAIGVTASLLATGAPFGFMALLGAMSLAGMMIKNAIVLIDEIRLNEGAGQGPYDAIVNAGLSRVRPVMLAAGTTVLGVIPLLSDVFWVSMAVVIMGGLAFGTVLTMLVVPVLYAVFYRVRGPQKSF